MARLKKTGDDNSDRLIDLLIEYTEKMRQMMDVRSKGMLRGGQREFGRLVMALEELSHFASQKIEYSASDDILRLEYQLRLAEFESIFNSFRIEFF